MRMHRVNGILAVSTNNVVGQKDSIPWHHSGDFKHFKTITMDHGILMGYPTFIGIAKNYTKPGKQVLPGRIIFVVGREPFDTILDIDQSNVIMLPTYGPKDDIETAIGYLRPDQTLFIAGGARIYRDYLKYAEKVYFTLIDIKCPVDHDTIFLTDMHPGDKTTYALWAIVDKTWRTITHTGSEICNGLKASYITFDSVL